MLHFSRFKIISIALICLAGLVAASPNFFKSETLATFPNYAPKQQLSLGLDLRGGAHLLLQMSENALRKDWLGSLRGDVRKKLRDAKIRFSGLAITPGGVKVTILKPEQQELAIKKLRELISPIGNAILGSTGNDLVVTTPQADTILVAPTSQGFKQRVTDAASAAIETVRRRIEPLGNKEASIVRQGSNRILVQVPGFDDTEQLKKLIGKTAKMTFHDVHPQVTPDEARATRVPFGYKIYESIEEGEPDLVLREIPVVQGADLVDAQPGFDSRDGQPIVSFRFNHRGARLFGAFTSKNVGRPFAIVLDDKVVSAPRIITPILGGAGQITGNFKVEEVNELAIQLRSGALPTPLTIVEERTVGPSLGKDSVDAGKNAAVVAGIAVSIFMVLAYGLFGLFALAAVFVNLVLIVGVMSMIGSTLTLPGIAGLILTVGMAVDANVLIYERIREEMRNGKQPISAIESGFTRAFGTIIDSNLTTLIAGLVMFWLGAGPVRGFAVTLSLGILATIFTAFTVTRLLVALWVSNHNTRKIPAPL